MVLQILHILTYFWPNDRAITMYLKNAHAAVGHPFCNMHHRPKF